MTEHTKVVIVGGGVIGLSVAHHLGRLGESRVVLYEQDSLLGTGSSGASAGGIRQQFGEEANVLYAMEGVRQFLAFGADTGLDPDFRQHGYLLLATTPERLDRLTRDVAMQNRLGLASEILTPDEVARRFPVLTTGDLSGAAFCGSDGYLDPGVLVRGWARSAKEAGIEIATGTEVVEFLRDGDAVTGVRTAKGDIRAEFTLLAGGPWSGKIAERAGLGLPLSTCRRQIFTTRPLDIPRDLPLVIDMDHPFYFRPELDGVILSGAEVEETRDFDLHLDESHLEEIVERAVARCPALAEAEIEGGWVGLRTLTPDGSAILGDVAGVPGLLFAVGMSGHGITHAPAVGRALAERIIRGAPESLPLEPFRADRFLDGTRSGHGGAITG